MKPVELEILMKDGLTSGLRNAGRIVRQFSKDTAIELKEVSTSLKLQKEHVKGLEKELKALEKSLKSGSLSGEEWMKASARVKELRAELDGEKQGLQELIDKEAELKAASEGADASLRQQLRNLTQEIASLMVAYAQLTEEEKASAEGKALQQHIEDLTEQAGVLRDAMADTSAAINNAASDTRGFDQLAGAMQLAIDGFGLMTSGAEMFGISQEDLVEAQTKLQAALVASNALSSMQNNLQRQSALMQGVNIIQTKAAAAAENIKTAAQGRGVVATKLATIAQTAFNAVARANPYVLLATACLTVVGALYAFSKGSKKAAEEEAKRQQQMEKAKQEQQEYVRAVAESAGKQIASYFKLKNAWESLGDSFSKKKKFIVDTKDEWHKLGKEIKTVNEMEAIFKDGTQSMISAIMYRAEIKAYEKRIEKVADEMADEIEKNKRYSWTYVTKGKEVGGYDAPIDDFSAGHYWKSKDFSDEELKAIEGHTYKEGNSRGGTVEYLDEEGAKIVSEMREKAAADAARKKRENAKKEGEEKIKEYLGQIESLNKAVEKEMEKLPGEGVDPDEPTDEHQDPQQKALEKARAEKEVTELIEKSRRDREKLLFDLASEQEQNEINALADAAERRRRQLQLDHDKELAQLAQQREREVESEKERQKQVFDAREAAIAAGNKDYVKRQFFDSDIDQSQIDKINSQYDNLLLQLRQKQARDRADMLREDIASMRDYLAQYGNYQQQKLAIAEEYARKIAAAENEGQRLSLEAERDRRLASVETAKLKSDISWEVVFGEFGGMFNGILRPTLEQLQKYMQTDEFKNSPADTQKEIIEAAQQMKTALGGIDEVGFSDFGRQIESWQVSLSSLRSAEDAYALTVKKAKTAEEAYIKAIESGTEAEQKAAKEVWDTAKAAQQTAEAEMKTAQDTADKNKQIVTTSATNLKTAMDNVTDGFQKLASNSLYSAYQGMIALGNGLDAFKAMGKFGDMMGEVAGALESAPIVGFVAQLLDLFKDGISQVLTGILDAAYGAVSGILSDVLTGELFVSIAESIYDGVGRIFDSLTFGGFTHWFNNTNAREVAETIENLTDRNETLSTAISDLTDVIKAGRGTESVNKYMEAVRLQQEVNANYLAMAQAQAGYHNAHHSFNYSWGGYTQEQIDRLSAQIGRRWDGDLFSLSPEEMKMLRANVDMWEQIKSTGDGGYGERVADRLDDYIEQAGKLEDLTTGLQESLTGISFDSLLGSFVDTLMDMDASAADTANKISEYFMKAMLSNKIGELFADRLESWWSDFSDTVGDENLSEVQREHRFNELRQQYMAYIDEAALLRDQLADVTGYNPDTYASQSGKSGSFSAMSQDQGTKLEGLFVSVQMHTASIDEQMEDVSDKMSQATESLRKIEENTRQTAERVGKVSDNIEKIIRDGIKTR